MEDRGQAVARGPEREIGRALGHRSSKSRNVSPPCPWRLRLRKNYFATSPMVPAFRNPHSMVPSALGSGAQTANSVVGLPVRNFG